MGKNETVERREPSSNWIMETAVVGTWETEGGIGCSAYFVYIQYIKSQSALEHRYHLG